MVFDLSFFLDVGPGLLVIFRYGFKPEEGIFFELTEDQYEKLRTETEVTQRWYAVIPKEQNLLTHELFIVSEDDKENLLSAANMIEKYCTESGQSFTTYDEKLHYVASQLPDAFSENTKYDRYKLRLV